MSLDIVTHNAGALLGAGSTALTAIPSASIADNSRCLTEESLVLYYHKFDITSEAAHSPPDVIRPNDYTIGTWKLLRSLLDAPSLIDHSYAGLSLDLDCASYDTHLFSCDQATLTLTITSLAVGGSISLVIEGADDCVITWPTEVTWEGGAEPSFTSGFDRVVMQRVSSTEIQASLAGQGYA